MVQRASVKRTRLSSRHGAHVEHPRPTPSSITTQALVPRTSRTTHPERALRRVHRELRRGARLLTHRQPQAARHQPARLRLPHSVPQGLRRRRQRRRHQNGREQSQHGNGAQLSPMQVK